jgi:hypothetical protein
MCRATGFKSPQTIYVWKEKETDGKEPNDRATNIHQHDDVHMPM